MHVQLKKTEFGWHFAFTAECEVDAGALFEVAREQRPGAPFEFQTVTLNGETTGEFCVPRRDDQRKSQPVYF